jgi:hypothetical protein
MRPDDGTSSFGSGYCWQWHGSWDFLLAMVSVIFSYLGVIGFYNTPLSKFVLYSASFHIRNC